VSQHTVSIKVDTQTAQKLAQLPNRSEFIRQALMDALLPRCPLCGGTGRLPSGHRLAREYSMHLKTKESGRQSGGEGSP
jgi:hypothetical protein